MRKIKEHKNNGGKCLRNFKHYLNIVTVFHTKTAALSKCSIFSIKVTTTMYGMLLAYLTSEQLELRDAEPAVVIINSQNNRKYRELLLMYKKIHDLTAGSPQSRNI